MTAQEALKIVDQVCGVVQMNRADHLNVNQALSILQALAERDEEAKKDKEKKPE